MEIDLEHHQARAETFRAQICIIGAGIAGLTLAHRLNQQGIDVALLEAGGAVESSTAATNATDPDLFAQAQLSGRPHLGTREGRVRVFGGLSLRWGGQLLPLPNTPEPAWPIAPQELAPQYHAAEQLLGVDDLPYDFPAFFDVSHTTRPPLLAQFPELAVTFSKWTPFGRRNLAVTLGRDILAKPRVSVYLHAQVTELLLAPARTHLAAVLVGTRSGATFRFEADRYILAAGTVETSRLLLASRSIAPEGVGNAYRRVGRNFHDHLTLPAATLAGPARATFLREFRPWIFPRGARNLGADATLHSAKLEASPELRERLDLNPVLAHLTIDEPEGSGLSAMREFLLARQRGDLLSGLATHAAHIPSAAFQALRLASAATLHHRRFVSARAIVTLRLNAAQDTPSLSRVTLSDKLDPFGLPQPVVDWRITPRESATLRTFAAHLRARLAVLSRAAPPHDVLSPEGFQWLPELFTPSENHNPPLPHLEDARHAMGGACMGDDPHTSVVDADLTVHGVANLFIASAATFPTGSPPLPTLPLMALSLRLADQLAAQLLK
jgi:choline dehydrogenase-like flavoprotein